MNLSEQIKASLTQLLLDGAHLQQMIDTVETLLGNPLSLADNSWNEPVRSKGYPANDVDDRINRRSNMALKEYELEVTYINNQLAEGVPHIAARAYMRRRRLLCGCVVNGQLMGGIRFPDIGRPLETLDREAVMTAAQLMGVALILNGWPHRTDAVVESLLRSLLSGKIEYSYISHSLLHPALEGINSFRLLWYLPADSAARGLTLEQRVELPSGISHWWEVPFGDGVVVLADALELDRHWAALEDTMQRLELLLAVSDSFAQVSTVKEQLGLVQETLYYAFRDGKRKGLVCFNEYKLHHLVSLSMESPTGRFCRHNALHQIDLYDRKNRSEYLKTLRVFLFCNQDAAAAAEKLCIHKNTVFYRLGRLQELFGLTLTNTKEMASLFCSFLMEESFACDV